MMWINYGKSWREFMNATELATPGTKILVRDTSDEKNMPVELLIGDINELGGVCDDCKHEALCGKPIVLKYLPKAKR